MTATVQRISKPLEVNFVRQEDGYHIYINGKFWAADDEVDAEDALMKVNGQYVQVWDDSESIR